MGASVACQGTRSTLDVLQCKCLQYLLMVLLENDFLKIPDTPNTPGRCMYLFSLYMYSMLQPTYMYQMLATTYLKFT